MENFDQEVTEKLKINLSTSREFLSKYESWLWQLTKFFLNDCAVFDDKQLSFYLKNNPFVGERIFPGPYRIKKDSSEDNVYRIGHPLAQRIIGKCKEINTPFAQIDFNYSASVGKISVIEPLIGMSGLLVVYLLTVSAFDTEDYIINVGVTEDRKILSEDQCKRMFSLDAQIKDISSVFLDEDKRLIENMLQKQKSLIISSINERNGKFFEEEIEKLNYWSEDKRNGLKVVLKEYDEQILLLKKEARMAANLPDKLEIQKRLRDIDKKRDVAWKEYDESVKLIEKQKDELLDRVEARLKQNVEEKALFTIRWQIV